MLRKTLHPTTPQEPSSQTLTPASHRSFIVPLNDGDTSGSSSSFSAGNGPITSTPVHQRAPRRSMLNESAGSTIPGEGSSAGMMSTISTIRPAVSTRRALRSPPPGSNLNQNHTNTPGSSTDSTQTRRFASSLSRRTREKSGSESFVPDPSLMDERSLSIATIQHAGDGDDGEEGFDSRELPDSHEGSLRRLDVSGLWIRGRCRTGGNVAAVTDFDHACSIIKRTTTTHRDNLPRPSEVTG